MTAEDIQEILENLGEKVSILAEENRVRQTQHEARSEERRVGKECRSRW